MNTSNRFALLEKIRQEEEEEGRDWGLGGGRMERNRRGGGPPATATSTPRRNGEEVVHMDHGAEQVREDNTRKRTATERSPTVTEEERNLRRRLNEFDVGDSFQEIMEVMKAEMVKVVEKAQVGVKEPLQEGLESVYRAISKLMDKMTDGIAQERIDRDTEMMKMDDRVEKLEKTVQELGEVSDSLTDNRIRNRVKDSAVEMEKKVVAAMQTVRVMDIDMGSITDNKKVIAKATIDAVSAGTKEEDRRWLDSVLRRTRIVVLGKGTQARRIGGKTIHTVPILFCCQNKLDSGDLETLLRKAGYFPGFHWPEEILPFVRNIREEVVKMGVDESNHYIRVRPEVREGAVQIRVDSKTKNGGKFVMKGVWRCPPLNKELWGDLAGLYTPKVVGRQ